jgi:hypothetical protein
MSGGATNATGGEAEQRSTGKVATFGGEGLSGSLTLQFNTELDKVQWTTSDITVPMTLIQEKCGDSTGEHGFRYSINEAWRHFTPHAQGADCGELWTGGHWDPTAVCSRGSLNGACLYCLTELYGYKCSPETFGSGRDSKGSFAYRWLNDKACELGDLSGMKGELKAVLPEDNETESITIPPLLLPGGLSQMSAQFGSISFDSVYGHTIGINCDSSGPPAAHGTNCECVGYNGKHSPSIGTMSVFHPHHNSRFARAGGWSLSELEGKSIVVRCGSSFGTKAGTPVFCAKLK